MTVSLCWLLCPELRPKIYILICVSAIVIFATIVCTTLAALILAYADKLAKHSWDVPLGIVVAASTQKVSNNANIWVYFAFIT